MKSKKKKKKNALVPMEDYRKVRKEIKRRIREKKNLAEIEHMLIKKGLSGKIDAEKMRRYIREKGPLKAKEVIRKMEEGMNFRHAASKAEGTGEIEKKIKDRTGLKGPIASEISIRMTLKGGASDKTLKEVVKEMIKEGIISRKTVKENYFSEKEKKELKSKSGNNRN